MGGMPAPEKKLPFERLRGMAEARQGRTRRRGVRERAGVGGAAVGRPEVEKKGALVDRALEGPFILCDCVWDPPLLKSIKYEKQFDNW
jgi:hypothetical protein